MTTDFVAPATVRDRNIARLPHPTPTTVVARAPHRTATRAVTLAAVAPEVAPGLISPRVDEHDVLWRGSTWCALAPIEATIVRTLLECRPRVVSRDEITARVWPDGAPKGRPVDGRLHRLRERLAPLGMHIHSIRQRGLLLAVDPPD